MNMMINDDSFNDLGLGVSDYGAQENKMTAKLRQPQPMVTEKVKNTANTDYYDKYVEMLRSQDPQFGALPLFRPHALRSYTLLAYFTQTKQRALSTPTL